MHDVPGGLPGSLVGGVQRVFVMIWLVRTTSKVDKDGKSGQDQGERRDLSNLVI